MEFADWAILFSLNPLIEINTSETERRMLVQTSNREFSFLYSMKLLMRITKSIK